MNSEPLVLIPGLNCTARLYRDQIEALGVGRQIVVPDHASAPTIPDMARRMLADLPPRFALAGLSMGGYIAFELWRQAPGRITRLALLDTSARPDSLDARANREDAIALVRAGQFARVVAANLPRLLAPASLAMPDRAATVKDMANTLGAERYILQQQAIMARADSRPTLASISVPTLVLVGAEDALTPPELSREMADGIPGARLEVVPASGHLSTIEAAGTVTAAVREWLMQ